MKRKTILVLGLTLLTAHCGLSPRTLGPRPDAEVCLGDDASQCDYWASGDATLPCVAAEATAKLDYLLVNAGELELEYELIPDDATDPGFVMNGPASGRVPAFGEQPFSVACDSACLAAFRAADSGQTSWTVKSNDPRRPRFKFVVHHNPRCR